VKADDASEHESKITVERLKNFNEIHGTAGNFDDEID